MPTPDFARVRVPLQSWFKPCRSLPMNNGLYPGVFSFPMSSLCHSMLDACPGALGLVDPRNGLLHVNQRLAALFPALQVGMDAAAILACLGSPGQEGLRPGARFVAGGDDGLCGIQLSAFHQDDAEFWLLSATPIAAQPGMWKTCAIASSSMLCG